MVTTHLTSACCGGKRKYHFVEDGYDTWSVIIGVPTTAFIQQYSSALIVEVCSGYSCVASCLSYYQCAA